MKPGINLELEVIEEKPTYEYNEEDESYRTIPKVRYGVQLHIDKTVHISMECREHEVKAFLEAAMNSLALGISNYGSGFTVERGLELMVLEVEQFGSLD